MKSRALALGLLVIAAAGCLGTGTRRIDASCREMRATVVWEMLRDNPTIRMVDIRSPDDVKAEEGRVKNALVIPYLRLHASLPTLAPYKTTTLVVLGRDGEAGHRACELLRRHGFQWVVYVSGGAAEWFHAGLPPVSPEPTDKPAAR